jgi:hypothetical protein
LPPRHKDPKDFILSFFLGVLVPLWRKEVSLVTKSAKCIYLLFYTKKNIGQNQGSFHKIVISAQKKYHNNLDLTLVHDIETKICINFFRKR